MCECFTEKNSAVESRSVSREKDGPIDPPMETLAIHLQDER